MGLGNTGVTQMGVVERGMLQRDEAREDQTDNRSNVFKVPGGAGGGELPRERAGKSVMTDVSSLSEAMTAA